MSFKAKLIGIACAVAFATPVHATTYTGNEQFGDAETIAKISITTDGTTGALTTNNITSWDILIQDSAGVVDLTPSNSQEIIEHPGDLTASPMTLTFDFSGSNGTVLLFQSPILSGGGPFYCVTSAPDCFLNQNSNGAIGFSTQQSEGVADAEIDVRGDSLVIAHAVAVPGPIVGAGLPGLIFAGGGLLGWWRRKRKGEAAI
jgi:hypothetical protein